jgi:uncharacterized Rossmann fold enzyme
MDFGEWEPAYEAILSDFGFDRAADQAARDRLADLTTPFDVAELEPKLAGQHVAIAGGAAGVTEDLAHLDDVDTVIAASVAAGTLSASDVSVDLMVTDLDKTPGVVRTLAEEGVPIAVHAHGDNMGLVQSQVPALPADAVLPTTQTEPIGPVRNFGGFTDGDRGAFLADHFGAARLSFPGWDLDDPTVGNQKRRKLTWAERLLHWLERRRLDRFGLLDGRRSQIELEWLR